MGTTLLFVRHGETDWNLERRYQGHLDSPLNDAGTEQAEAVADALSQEPVDAIYSSDLGRAHATAEVIGARLGLPVQIDAGLREVDVGSWAGLTREEVIERFGEGVAHDGESREEHSARVLGAVRRIAVRHPGGCVVLVSHGGSIRAVERAATGESNRVMGNCEVFQLASEQLD
jgi:probable phosphoglycerate mutase